MERCKRCGKQEEIVYLCLDCQVDFDVFLYNQDNPDNQINNIEKYKQQFREWNPDAQLNYQPQR